jgi:hypothetical protein
LTEPARLKKSDGLSFEEWRTLVFEVVHSWSASEDFFRDLFEDDYSPDDVHRVIYPESAGGE